VWALSSAKEGGDWKAFPDHCRDQKCLGSVTAQYPLAVHWTIAFDGRSDGQVATRNPEGFDFYSDVGQQKITSTGSVPTLGKPSQQFAGFFNGSVDRPLMANSKPYFSDPEHWRQVQLAPGVVGGLRKQFRQNFPQVSNCANADENIEKRWFYRAQRHLSPRGIFLETELVGSPATPRGVSM
jgi:hypothetical protein